MCCYKLATAQIGVPMNTQGPARFHKLAVDMDFPAGKSALEHFITGIIPNTYHLQTLSQMPHDSTSKSENWKLLPRFENNHTIFLIPG